MFINVGWCIKTRTSTHTRTCSNWAGDHLSTLEMCCQAAENARNTQPTKTSTHIIYTYIEMWKNRYLYRILLSSHQQENTNNASDGRLLSTSSGSVWHCQRAATAKPKICNFFQRNVQKKLKNKAKCCKQALATNLWFQFPLTCPHMKYKIWILLR